MDDPKRAYDIDSLKILIVSTSKTGNTWVRYLLAKIYDLPMVPLSLFFDADEVSGQGPRWIAHQHYFASPELIEYAQHNNIMFVTTVRHPCDTLLSLFHFVRNCGSRPVFTNIGPPMQMVHDGEVMGEHTAAYVRESFAVLLDVSLGWIRSGKSHMVRYEDLKRDPLATLQGLTAGICPASDDRIQRAIELCDIDRMRQIPGEDPKFFRRGEVGRWRAEMPQQIIDILRHTEPYPSQFAELGYSLDQDYPMIAVPETPPSPPTLEWVQPELLKQVYATAHVNPHLPIAWPTWPKGVWPKVEALAQKVVRRLLRWYINPIVEQQNQFNQAVAQALEEMWQEIVEPQEPLVSGPQERRSENE
jgi:hypothetical protein